MTPWSTAMTGNGGIEGGGSGMADEPRGGGDGGRGSGVGDGESPAVDDRRGRWNIRQGNAIERLRQMPAGSVRCCVTSPPYFGLRDYGTGEWAGGEDGCDHRRKNPEVDQRTSTLGPRGTGLALENAAYQHGKTFRDECGKCGARRIDMQIGLEATPDEYVGRLVEVFREVRRALADDGTLWLNVGDSYADNANGRHSSAGQESRRQDRMRCIPPKQGLAVGLKPKDLHGIPWLLAFALRSDGWYLRSDIIWAKPNPMPESVTDRPTSAHEHLFLLAKSARYFYDADAIREPDSGQDHARSVLGGQPSLELSNGLMSPHRGLRTTAGRDGLGRNCRNVWEIATQPYAEAHFATFPPKLALRCILAGSAPGDTILDPFAGAGTVGVVALRHDRGFVGVELSADYCAMARRRICDDAPLLNTPAESPVRSSSAGDSS